MFKFCVWMLAVFSSVSMAAKAIVWDTDGNSDLEPAYWYDYTYGTGASVTASKDENNTLTIDFVAPATTTSAGAGYGFGYKQDDSYKDVAISIAAYSGVCMTYKAEQPFRMDFKQSTITDDNYWGADVSASLDLKKTFFAFSDFTQGWKSSTTVKWNAQKQYGVQFGYKNTHAKLYGTSNTVVITSFILSDSCETFAPTLLEPYASENPAEITLNETDTLVYVLSDIFTDADGDDLTITANVKNLDANAVTLLNSGTSFTLLDTLKFVPKANLDSGLAIITLSATDGSNSVLYQVSVTTIDAENPPVAVGDRYEVNEDAVLTVSYKNGVLINDYDIDNDEFTMNKLTDPLHGTLEVNEDDGSFVYTPDADYFGIDSWTYNLTETKTDGKTSATATVTIVVKNVNDAPTVTVNDTSFMNVTPLLEDFEDTVTVKIPKSSVTFNDVDGDALTFGVKTNGLIHAELLTTASYYYVELTAVEDANGSASVTLFATDGKDSAGVTFFVDITPVADPPKAVADTYEANEDETLKVNAKNGVLANDKAGDNDLNVALVAVLDRDALHGSVELSIDGSFTYTPEADFYGEDSFTYHCVGGDESSNITTVTIIVNDMNDAPIVVVDTSTLDTTVEEEFKKNITYSSKVFSTWFEDPDGDKLYYAASSDDGKLKVVLNSTTLIISSVKDSIGDAYVSFTATDSIAGSATVRLHFFIENTNDAPKAVFVEDSIYVDSTSIWPLVYDVSGMFYDDDPEDTVLVYGISFVNANLTATLEGSTLTAEPVNFNKLKEGTPYRIIISATDAAGLSTTSKIALFLGEKPETFSRIKVANGNMSSWKSAILMTHGNIAVFDLQGNVVWKGQLPTTEADVRSALQRVSGNAILRINQRQWILGKQTFR